MKIERILVPTDFSDGSLTALKYAIELAREHESEVVLVSEKLLRHAPCPVLRIRTV